MGLKDLLDQVALEDLGDQVVLFVTIKNNCGPSKYALSNVSSFNEIIHHLNIFYLARNQGIKPIFQIDYLKEKSGLDTGACLRNMKNVFQLCN